MQGRQYVRVLLWVCALALHLVTLQVHAQAVGAEGPVPAAEPGTVPEPGEHARLVHERDAWQARARSPALPVTLASLGIASTVTGAILFQIIPTDQCELKPSDCEEERKFGALGLSLIVTGAALVVSALVVVTVRRHRASRAIRKIEEQLQQLSAARGLPRRGAERFGVGFTF